MNTKNTKTYNRLKPTSTVSGSIFELTMQKLGLDSTLWWIKQQHLCLHLELLCRIFTSISFEQPKDECLQSNK